MTESSSEGLWPALSHDRLGPTVAALQLWTQIAGKVALERTPWINHSWHVTLRLSARGLATPLMPGDGAALQLEFDVFDQQLVARTTDGGERRVPLKAGAVADFYHETMQALTELGAPTRIFAAPNEIAEAVPFADDVAQRPYDPDVARDFWRALVQIQRVFLRFRSGFLGKSSPIHFYWGAADLAVTRFSGRRAPLHPGGVPHLPDAVTQEAYSHEVSSAGFWAGDERCPEPSFYSYAYPAPPGFDAAPVAPAAARFDPALGEFLLSYEEVRAAADPDEALLQFLRSTYSAAADLGGWDRAALECDEGRIGRPRPVG